MKSNVKVVIGASVALIFCTTAARFFPGAPIPDATPIAAVATVTVPQVSIPTETAEISAVNLGMPPNAEGYSEQYKQLLDMKSRQSDWKQPTSKPALTREAIDRQPPSYFGSDWREAPPKAPVKGAKNLRPRRLPGIPY